MVFFVSSFFFLRVLYLFIYLFARTSLQWTFFFSAQPSLMRSTTVKRYISSFSLSLPSLYVFLHLALTHINSTKK